MERETTGVAHDFELATSTHRKILNKGVCKNGAGNEIRTRDLNLGKVALYQLSYSRITLAFIPSPGLENSRG